MSKHSTRRPRRSRRFKIATGVVSFVMAAGLGVALAAFLAHAPIVGHANSAQFSVSWKPASATVIDSADMTCTATVGADGKLDLEASKAYPGGHCTVRGMLGLSSDSAESGVVTGLDLTLPEGWTAALDQGGVCGQVLTVGSLAYQTAFTVTAGPDAQPGTSSTFAANDGVQVAPASTNPTLACTK